MQIIRHTRTERKLDEIAGSENSFLGPPGDSLSTLSPGSPAAAVWSSGLASWAGLAGSAWWAGVVGADWAFVAAVPAESCPLGVCCVVTGASVTADGLVPGT